MKNAGTVEIVDGWVPSVRASTKQKEDMNFILTPIGPGKQRDGVWRADLLSSNKDTDLRKA